MEFIKVTIFIIAITMGLSITILMKSINEVGEKPLSSDKDIAASLSEGFEFEVHPEKTLPPWKKLGRFLIEERNPRAADHCHKDNEICYYIEGGKNSTCCNNKCVNLYEDNHNCGACKSKCKFTQTCCRGQCVYIAYDKRHCGACNHRCDTGQLCVDGMCDYA